VNAGGVLWTGPEAPLVKVVDPFHDQFISASVTQMLGWLCVPGGWYIK